MQTWSVQGVETQTRAESWSPAIPQEAVDAAKLLSCWVLCVVPAVLSTSHQYTWSLLIFVAPLGLTSHALYRRGTLATLWKPLTLALSLLVPMGAVLTVGLADDFFVYPTTSATLGVTIPAFDLTGVDHAFQIPIEELAFYVLGFASLLLLYAWADEVLVPRPRALGRRLDVSLPEFLVALAGGVSLCVAGWAVQRVANPTATAPGYWMYLMLVPLPVMVAYGPAVAHRINWSALVLVCLALWGHSILWEVTLAIPQGWWGYQRASMLGLEVAAWHRLPLEAVLVWLMTPLATIITYETLRARLAFVSRRSP